MERLADHIAELYELRDHPIVGNTLEDAAWLEEESLGYPLNLLCSLYYESTNCEPFLSQDDNPQPENNHPDE